MFVYICYISLLHLHQCEKPILSAWRRTRKWLDHLIGLGEMYLSVSSNNYSGLFSKISTPSFILCSCRAVLPSCLVFFPHLIPMLIINNLRYMTSSSCNSACTEKSTQTAFQDPFGDGMYVFYSRISLSKCRLPFVARAHFLILMYLMLCKTSALLAGAKMAVVVCLPSRGGRESLVFCHVQEACLLLYLP